LDVIIQVRTRTPQKLYPTSIFPVFALSIKHRNASKLSVDGSLMSDFGLYKSHVGGTLRGKVPSVCRMQVNSGITLRATAFFSYLEKGTLWPFCENHEVDIGREGEFAKGKFVGESLCVYHLLDSSHV
jgi:hypothetical protein